MERGRQLGIDFGGGVGGSILAVLQKGARFGKRPLELHLLGALAFWLVGR